jgi:hypothetical protein
LKSPSPSRASLVRHSLYKLNKIGDKQHPCRTPLPICTLLVSPLSSHTLTFWSMYNLLINLLSHQSIAAPFSICINLVQFTQSNAFCQSMKQTHSSSSISKVRTIQLHYKNKEYLKKIPPEQNTILRHTSHHIT